MYRTLPILLVAALLPASARAQSVVEFDHATGTARLIEQRAGRADTTPLGRSPSVRIDRSKPTIVRIVNTNTALYRFAEESEKAPLPELESLRGFMSRATPYVPALRAAATRSVRSRGGLTPEEEAESARAAVRTTSAALRDVTRNLANVDAAVFGAGGVQDLTTQSLFALEQMRRGARPEDAAASLRQAAGLGGACVEEPVRLPATAQLLTALSELPVATQALRRAVDVSSHPDDVSWVAVRDSAQLFERQAQTALTDFESLVDAAYRAERLVRIVGHACSSWSTRPVTVSRTEGRTVSVSVEPRTDPDLARLAERGPTRYEVTIQPRTFVRPSLVPVAIAAPDARFARYGTRPTAAGDGAEVYETGRKDSRFAIGASLGFTWPWLDRRESGGLTIWAPEISVGKGSGTHAFGVGPAVSWGIFKVGAGALWVHHETLKRVGVGQVLPTGTEVPLEEVYGAPRGYVSLSVLTIPSFGRR